MDLTTHLPKVGWPVNRFGFGIGCFHFGVSADPPFVFDPAKYLADLHSLLNSEDNISNLTISPEVLKSNPRKITSKAPDANEGRGIFPRLDMEITFEVYIPFRVQERLLKRTPRTDTEHFAIHIVPTAHAPVALVHPVDGAVECKVPSQMVIVTRKFLKERLSKGPVVFQNRGPSPFHANFFVEGGVGTYSYVARKRGYARLTFGFDGTSELQDAAEDIFMRLAEDLGTFYHLSDLRTNRLFNRFRIEERLESVVGLGRGRGVSGWWWRLTRSDRLINELFVELGQYEASTIELKNFSARNPATGELSAWVDDFIQETATRDGDLPVEHLWRLAQHFETARTSNSGNLALILSAVVGGVVGVLLTRLL